MAGPEPHGIDQYQSPYRQPRAQRQLERNQTAQRMADQRQPRRAPGCDLGGEAGLNGIDEGGERRFGVEAAARGQRRSR